MWSNVHAAASKELSDLCLPPPNPLTCLCTFKRGGVGMVQVLGRRDDYSALICLEFAVFCSAHLCPLLFLKPATRIHTGEGL